jgi:hypothetical protein
VRAPAAAPLPDGPGQRAIGSLQIIEHGRKSQVPFPEEIATATACITRDRSTSVDSDDVLRQHRGLIHQLLEQQGFQLPTVSAVAPKFSFPGSPSPGDGAMREESKRARRRPPCR